MKQSLRLKRCLFACYLSLFVPVALGQPQPESSTGETLEVVSLMDQLAGRWRAVMIEGEAVSASMRVCVMFNPKGLGAVEAQAEEAGSRQRVGFTYAVAGDDTLSVVMDDAGEEPLAFTVRFEKGVLVMAEQAGQTVSRLVREPVQEDASGV